MDMNRSISDNDYHYSVSLLHPQSLFLMERSIRLPWGMWCTVARICNWIGMYLATADGSTCSCCIESVHQSQEGSVSQNRILSLYPGIAHV